MPEARALGQAFTASQASDSMVWRGQEATGKPSGWLFKDQLKGALTEKL